MKDNLNDLSMTDRALYKINLATIKSDDPRKQWGQQHLNYYITTGRASTDFIKSINQMEDKYLIRLIGQCSCGCANNGIAIAKYWAPRYSGHMSCDICGDELIAGENWYTLRQELVCTKCHPDQVPNDYDVFHCRKSEAEITGDCEESILTRQEMYEE